MCIKTRCDLCGLPRAACHIQDAFAALLAQQIYQEVLVVVSAGVLITNEYLPDLGSLAIGILVPHSFRGDAFRSGYEHAISRGCHFECLALASRSN